jgi:class 3 adenylate cyclase
MGEHIPGARMVELPGNDHLPWEGDRDALLDEIERFLTGVGEEVGPDRVLATLLFTDIVGSTAKAAELGDGAWQDLLTKHHRLVRAQLARFRGREVDMAGDGVFAAFDGPARAVRCASAIADGLKALGLDVRAGVHTGEIEQANGSVRGIAVHIAARIAAAAQPARCSRRARSRTSSPARGLFSTSAASTNSRAFRAPGTSSPPGGDRGPSILRTRRRQALAISWLFSVCSTAGSRFTKRHGRSASGRSRPMLLLGRSTSLLLI